MELQVTDYNDITMARYMRIIIKQCVVLHDIGFSDSTVNGILELAVDEIIRIMKDI